MEREEPVQASVGGVVKVEPPVGDRVSDSLQQDEEVEVLEMTLAVKEERLQVTVVEDDVLEESSPGSHRRVRVLAQKYLSVCKRNWELQTGRSLTALSGRKFHDTDEAESRMRTSVADQVRRWEEVPSGRTLPPNVKFTWVNCVPDSKFLYDAAVNTLKYLLRWTPMANQAEAWVSKLQPKPNKFGMTRDLAGLMVPIGELSPLEITAILQTLLTEAGFELPNLIPGWSRTANG
ncbi:hypothetical protein PHMEG_0005642 [Phytophthora megakarya]|uniref:Uncharacterized protein n=1 Tax=Phytophthora megakarya TaxID=4795 RepID=A0A225WSH5_9STRA|nr:hypothetical protein PHMEG_0005642 [Phytophthora megakarya]